MLSSRNALLQSEEKLKSAILRLFDVCGKTPSPIFSMLSIEQQFHLIERDLFLSRPDLLRAGRTLYTLSEKVEPLSQERIAPYLQDVDQALFQMGIKVGKGPLFEKTPLAIDHNLLRMESMRQIAVKHNLASLFHEKPFEKKCGSGKLCRWSLYTDKGENLLDPKGDPLIFSFFLTASFQAIREYAPLLWAAVSSAGNDERLTKPAVIALDYGKDLEALLSGKRGEINEHAFCIFVENALEFRVLGSSIDPTLLFTSIHSIIAESLELILDEWTQVIGDRKLNKKELFNVALPILKKNLEVDLNHLPQFRKSFYAFEALLQKKIAQVFEGVFTEQELHRLYEAKIKEYVEVKELEANVVIDLFGAEEVKTIQMQIADMGYEAKGRVYSELIAPKMEALRKL